MVLSHGPNLILIVPGPDHSVTAVTGESWGNRLIDQRTRQLLWKLYF